MRNNLAMRSKTMIIFSLVLLISGCGDRDVVVGTPRGDSNPAKFDVGNTSMETRPKLGKELAL